MSASQNALMRTVSDDHCGFFNSNAKVNAKKVIDFLQYKKADVAKAANISSTTVRYEDNKIPKELQERLTEWAVTINLVAGFFKNDQNKTMLWFIMPNPLLGGVSPRDMIRMGRFKKLLIFIQTALNENQQSDMNEGLSTNEK